MAAGGRGSGAGAFAPFWLLGDMGATLAKSELFCLGICKGTNVVRKEM